MKRGFSLQSKIFLMTMFVALVVMLLSLFFLYRQAAVIIERNALQYIKGVVVDRSLELDSMLDDGRSVALMAAMNTSIQEAVNVEYPPASFERFLQKKLIDSYLVNLIVNKDYIERLAVFSLNGNVFQSGGSLLLHSEINEGYMQLALETPEEQLHYLQNESRLIFTRPIVADKKITALVVVEMNYSYMETALQTLSFPEQLYLAVFYRDSLIFDNAVNQIRPVFDTEELLFQSYKSDQENKTKKGDFLFLTHESNNDEVRTIGMIPYKVLIGDALTFRSTLLWIVGISIPLIFLTSWLLSARLSQNISQLNKTMQKVGEGNLAVRSDVKSNDEIGEMAIVFNTMMNQIESLLKQIKETEKQKRKHELAILQAQIHPHFVYNTINSMKYFAHLKGVPEIEAVATAMVELLRVVLGQGAEFIPFSEEIHYTKQYLIIQKFKYQQNFSIKWEIEDAVEDIELPKLLLQPIVENALIHGIANRPEGSITIKAYVLEGVLHISVTDNGKGMSKKELNQVLSRVNSNGEYLSGVGIPNVFNRIQMIYGKQYGGRITSYVDLGTVVELRLPV